MFNKQLSFSRVNQYQQAFVAMRGFASVYNYRDAKNPQVFFTVSRDGKPMGKMVFEVSSLWYQRWIIALQEPSPKDCRKLQIFVCG